MRSDHQRTTAEVFNTAGMPTLPTHTQQEFSGDATTITHAQSRVQAGSGKVTIETSGDATVTGAQVEARRGNGCGWHVNGVVGAKQHHESWSDNGL